MKTKISFPFTWIRKSKRILQQDDELRLTLCDALAGWKYIREAHGDLYGVGWDRVQDRLEMQIAITEQR